jgi:quinol-cytochrome oxidoreductase complex cytochrome b subunit
MSVPTASTGCLFHTVFFQGLRSLFGTLMLSLPAFWNVGGLLALMFFIYAYIGMLLLGHVKRNG